MSDRDATTPRDAELIDFLARMGPGLLRRYETWLRDEWESWCSSEDWYPEPQFDFDPESIVGEYRYEVRNLAESIPLVGGPFAGTMVQVQRAGDWASGDPSPWYEIRQAGQRHHYTLTRLHCGHWEYRYREDAPPEEEL